MLSRQDEIRRHNRLLYVESLLLSKSFTTEQILNKTLETYPEWLTNKRKKSVDAHEARKKLKTDIHQICASMRKEGFDAGFVKAKSFERRAAITPKQIEEWFSHVDNTSKLSYNQRQGIGKVLGFIK